LDYGIFFVFFFAYTRYFGEPTDDGGYQVQGCVHTIALLVAWAMVLPLPEAVFGRTFGKWACDLRVVGPLGGPVAVHQAFIRRLLDPIDLSFFGLVGYLVAKNTPLAQRVGDLVGNTRVIEDQGTDVSAA
jgi:uncharacterized RDD family membrane protein YckC